MVPDTPPNDELSTSLSAVSDAGSIASLKVISMAVRIGTLVLPAAGETDTTVAAALSVVNLRR